MHEVVIFQYCIISWWIQTKSKSILSEGHIGGTKGANFTVLKNKLTHTDIYILNLLLNPNRR